MKKKKLLRFVALISLIVLSMNVDLFARGGGILMIPMSMLVRMMVAV